MAFSDALIKVHQPSSATTFNTAIFNWKEDMVTAGWLVLGSSDNVTYENTGQTAGSTGAGSGGGYDLWDADTDISRTAAANEGSWIRLKTPGDAPMQYEFCLMIDTNGGRPDSDNHFWRLEYSYDSSGFDTGGAAGVAPTATDMLAPGQLTPGSQARGGSTIGKYLHGDAAGETFWAIGDRNEGYDWMLWTMRDALTVFGCIGHVYMNVRNSQWSGGDTQPYVHIMGFRSSAALTDNYFDVANPLLDVPNDTTGSTQESYTVSTPAWNDEGGAYGMINAGSGQAWEGTYGLAINRSDISGDLVMDRETETGTLMMLGHSEWGTEQANIQQMLKGVSTGDLLKGTRYPFSLAASFYTSLVQNTSKTQKRRLNIGFLSLPWPSTTDFTVF